MNSQYITNSEGNNWGSDIYELSSDYYELIPDDSFITNIFPYENYSLSEDINRRYNDYYIYNFCHDNNKQNQNKKELENTIKGILANTNISIFNNDVNYAMSDEDEPLTLEEVEDILS